jgi:type I restriction enzyme S subunit
MPQLLLLTEEALLNSSTKWVPKNSILMALAGQGKTKGTVGILEIDATCNQSMAAIVPDEREINYDFLFYWLHSNYNRIRGLASSDQRDGLNLEIVGDIFCPIPSVEEQLVITSHLNNFDIKNDIVIEKLEIAIEKLQIYRQSLISEAVTGKIDVRDWQA